MIDSSIVSVVIPVYNVEQYLRVCLESIINQTYSKLEIILVNDGSTDSSLSICKEYEKKDSRVRVISQCNKGLSGARNTGIKVASGKYITFLDSDDFVSYDYIEYLIEILDPDTKISTCSYNIVYGFETESINKGKNRMKGNTIFSIHDYCIQAFNDVRYLAAWGKLYDISLFSNIEFPEGKLHEDIYIMANLLKMTDKISYGDEKKYYYVRRKGSITTSTFSERKFDLVEANYFFSNIISLEYPDLKDASLFYQLHGKSSLIGQIRVRDRKKYQSFITETINESRNLLHTSINDHYICRKEKILCIITATNFYLIKLAWKLFELIRR